LKNYWWVIAAIITLLFLRWLSVWFQVTKVNLWKVEEITNNLRERGIYIDNVAPGEDTEKLLSKEVNKVVLVWFCLITLFNIFFDNFFITSNVAGGEKLLMFTNWFGGVNIGVELLKQISSKYKYITSIN
jgi:preprotein translocase subunit SecY